MNVGISLGVTCGCDSVAHCVGVLVGDGHIVTGVADGGEHVDRDVAVPVVHQGVQGDA